MSRPLQLVIIDEDDFPDQGGRNRKPATIPGSLPEPIPIQYRLEEIQTPEGPATHQYVLWFNDEAARCRWCEPGQCNFQPTTAGVGTCLVKREGKLTETLPRLRGN